MKTTEELVKQCKSWRQRLDEILQEMKGQSEMRGEIPVAGPNEGAAAYEEFRQRQESITDLEGAIMRQGLVMKALDAQKPGVAPDPYPASYDPTSAKVEPTADGLEL